MKIYIMLLGLTLLLLSTYLYVYKQGLYDGERNYKKSKHMVLALEAAYKYGVWDCREQDKSKVVDNIYHVRCPQDVTFSFWSSSNTIHKLEIAGIGSGQCTINKEY